MYVFNTSVTHSFGYYVLACLVTLPHTASATGTKKVVKFKQRRHSLEILNRNSKIDTYSQETTLLNSNQQDEAKKSRNDEEDKDLAHRNELQVQTETFKKATKILKKIQADTDEDSESDDESSDDNDEIIQEHEKDLRTEIKTFKTVAKKIKQAQKELLTKNEEQTFDLQKIKSTLAKTQEKLKDLKKKNDTLTRKNKELTIAESELTETIKTLKLTLLAKQNINNQLQYESDTVELNKKVITHKTIIQKLQKLIKTLTQSNTALKEKVETQAETIKKNKKEKTQYTQTNLDLLNENEKLKKDVEEYQNQLEDLQLCVEQAFEEVEPEEVNEARYQTVKKQKTLVMFDFVSNLKNEITSKLNDNKRKRSQSVGPSLRGETVSKFTFLTRENSPSNGYKNDDSDLESEVGIFDSLHDNASLKRSPVRFDEFQIAALDQNKTRHSQELHLSSTKSSNIVSKQTTPPKSSNPKLTFWQRIKGYVGKCFVFAAGYLAAKLWPIFMKG